MNLIMNATLGTGYKSGCQIARIVSEDWAASNLYCSACDHASLTQSPNNARAVDFTCQGCKAAYQLKSGSTWNERRIPDAAYSTMIGAIKGDNVPNLLVMQYGRDWTVRNLLLVPSFFFNVTAIEKRKPLGPTARRAGWVGCTILLSAIAPEGKIRLVKDGVAEEPSAVRNLYKKVKPIEKLKGGLRRWALDILRIVHKIGRTNFGLADVYAFEPQLAELYPNNRHIRPKIRQQLQVLRDVGLIEFLGAGEYALRR